MSEATEQAVLESIRLASERLGPASERALGDAANQALLLSRLRSGSDLEDAVLWVLHHEIRSNPRVADEFLAYFLVGALKAARPALTPGLRRFLDTGDLVRSVLGDVWREFSELQFEGRAQFLSLLSQRLKWKASDHSKKLRRIRRREDLRSPQAVEDLNVADPGRSPSSIAGIKDEWDKLAVLLFRLPERDRLLLRLYLKGEPVAVMAEATGLDPQTARKALQRAMIRVRQLR